MMTTIRAWKIWLICKKYFNSALSPNTSLWYNTQLPNLGSILNLGAWAKLNVKTIDQVMHQGRVLSFVKLSEDFNIPESYFFRCMQLYSCSSRYICPRLISADRVGVGTSIESGMFQKKIFLVYMFTLFPCRCMISEGSGHNGWETFRS